MFLRTGRVDAGQRVARGVSTASRRRAVPAAEEAVVKVDHVGVVDLAVIVDVGRIHARRRRSSLPQVSHQEEVVRNVHAAIGVGIAPDEIPGLHRRWHRHERQHGDRHENREQPHIRLPLKKGPIYRSRKKHSYGTIFKLSCRPIIRTDYSRIRNIFLH